MECGQLRRKDGVQGMRPNEQGTDREREREGAGEVLSKAAAEINAKCKRGWKKGPVIGCQVKSLNQL